MLTIFGVIAVSIMFLSYWTEERSKWLVLVFAIGSGMTSLYSVIEGVYPITVIKGSGRLLPCSGLSKGTSERTSPNRKSRRS